MPDPDDADAAAWARLGARAARAQGARREPLVPSDAKRAATPGRPHHGRDPITLREAALQIIPVWMQSSCGSTPCLGIEFTQRIAPLAEDAVNAVDALVRDLVRVAPLADAGTQPHFRNEVIEIVRLARGLGADVLPPEPTRDQTRSALQAYLGELRAVAARVGANHATALTPEARAFVVEHGGGGLKDAVAHEIEAVDRALRSGSLERCGFLGRGRKGVGAVDREVARRLADLFARHVGPPTVNWSHATDSYTGLFLAWATLVLNHVEMDVEVGVLRAAAQERRTTP